MSNIRESGRDVQLSPIGYLAAQLFLIGPFNFVIAATGLVFLFSKAGARFRPLGWTFALVLAFFIITKGKDYYAAPAFPLALAAGAVAIERLTMDRWRRLRAVAVGLPLTVTALLLPLRRVARGRGPVGPQLGPERVRAGLPLSQLRPERVGGRRRSSQLRPERVPATASAPLAAAAACVPAPGRRITVPNLEVAKESRCADYYALLRLRFDPSSRSRSGRPGWARVRIPSA